MTEQISIGHPEGSPVRLLIDVGACRLTLKKGSPDVFVSGTYRDPTDERPCLVETRDGTVRIWQKRLFAFGGCGSNVIPEFLLEVSDRVPFVFEFRSNASEVFVDLGGLPVTRTTFRYGAGKATLLFTKPNPVAMESLDFTGNAGDLSIEEIANSGARSVSINGSAAGFKINLGGELRSDMKIQVSTSVSGIIMEVPRRANAVIRQNAVLGGASYKGDFRETKNGLETASYDPGQPNMQVEARISLGGLEVKMTS